MIWDGTSPLRPEHEVAYRGWPKERVELSSTEFGSGISTRDRWGRLWYHSDDGKTGSHLFLLFDLIPLQQEQPK